ncbi:hypothetical protein MMC26_000934 [Xylographa opegraphella]|nr:hypothetical protein [Xylographa opegraphella]
MQVNKGATSRHVNSLRRGDMHNARPTVANVLVHRQLPHTTKNLGQSINYAFHQTSALGQNKESVKITMDEHGTISPKTVAEWEAMKAAENKDETKNNRGNKGKGKGKAVDKDAGGKGSGSKA